MGSPGSEIAVFVGAGLFIALCILVGLYWERKRYSFIMGFLVSVFISPIIAYIIGLFLPKRAPEPEKQENKIVHAEV